MRSEIGTGSPRDPERRMEENLEESGTEVTIRWQEWPANTPVDPTTGSRVPDDTHQPIEKTGTIEAFVHAVNIAAHQVKQFNEIETGDVILDVAADAALDGKEALRFEILGIRYVQKPVSERLAKSWDVIHAGRRLHRSILLRKA